MRKNIVLLIFEICAAFAAHAQISIGGHLPFADTDKQSYLFVSDLTSFKNYSATVEVESDSGWTDVRIDGIPADGIIDFGDISDDKTFDLKATVNGKEISRTIRFTTLPVISIRKSGAFTNDYEQAKVVIDSPDGTCTNDTMNCAVKHRGGTTNSAGKHKRNYKLKIVDKDGEDKDVSLFGMRNGNKLILDGGQVDLFRMRNKICHDLWLDLSAKPYYFKEEPKAVNGCRTQEIELFINDEYRGIYNLMEPVDRKQLRLKKYKKTDGVHGLLYKTVSWTGTSFWGNMSGYDNSQSTLDGWEAKYPEPGDDADTTDYRPIADMYDFLNTSTDTEFRNGIAEMIDLPVFIDYTLFVNIINGIDNTGKNIYWSIYDKANGKYSRFVPTPWDMDRTFGWAYTDGTHQNITKMAVPTNPIVNITRIGYRIATALGREYSDMLDTRYAEWRHSCISHDSLQARFENAYEEIKRSGAAKRESAKWGGDTDISGHALDWETQLDNIKTWITARLEFLDDAYHYDSPTGIKAIKPVSQRYPQDGNTYNLQGQRVSSSFHGIVIRNGRKYIH